MKIIKRNLFVAAYILVLAQTFTVASQSKRPAIYIDKHVFQGVIKSVIFDNEQGAQKQFLDTGNGIIPIFLETDELVNAKVSITGKLNSQGVIVPNKIEVLEQQLKAAFDVPVSGVRTVAVLLLNFSNDTSEPVSVEQARQRIFTDPISANAYYGQVSKGRLSFAGLQRSDGDIFGYLTLPFSNENCTMNRIETQWEPAARNLAIQRGIDLNLYHHVVYVFPQNMPGCPRGGSAAIGQIGDNQTGKLNVALIGSTVFNSYYLITHELGHNLGLMHSGSRSNCQPAEPFEKCQNYSEYGDYDIMGEPDLRLGYLLNNYYQSRLGWLNGQTVTFDFPGIYYVNLVSPNHPTKRTTMVRIPLKNTTGNLMDKSSILLEFRRRLPPFDNSIYTDLFAHEGISIRYGNESPFFVNAQSFLIDTTPSTSYARDGMLLPGNTFANSYHGISITIQSVNPFFGVRIKIELTR